MLDLMYEYADDQERQADVYCEACEIAMDRAFLAYDTCVGLDNLRARAAELRYVTEGADDAEALMGYYEEAGASKAAAGAKQDNLLAKAWKAVVDFIQSIIDKVKGLFQKKCKKKEAEVPKWTVELINQVNKVKSKLGNFANDHRVLVAAVGAVGAGILLTGGLAAFKKKHSGNVKVSNSQGNKLVNTGEGLLSVLKKPAEAIRNRVSKGETQDGDGKSKGLVSKIVNAIKAAVMAIIGVFGSKGSTDGPDGQDARSKADESARVLPGNDKGSVMGKDPDADEDNDWDVHNSSADDPENNDPLIGEGYEDEISGDDDALPFMEDGTFDVDRFMAGLNL